MMRDYESVLCRKRNGESRVFDESMSELESGIKKNESISGGTSLYCNLCAEVEKPLAHYLSDLSLTSVTSTNPSCQPARDVKHPPCCKSCE